MTKYYEILRLYHLGISQRGIATSLSCSRNTVSKTIKRFHELSLTWPLNQEYSDKELYHLLFEKPEKTIINRILPDFKYVEKEMKKPAVTLTLLWTEYCTDCRISGGTPLMYSQYCNLYRKYMRKHRATMHIVRKPGESIEVDWAGTKASIYNRTTGEIIKVSIFVSALSYSGYGYAEAFYDEKTNNWIQANINMLQYFEGVAKMIIPDNLKTGVTKSNPYEPVINNNYAAFAKHYNTAIMPARIKRPKDKPTAEGSVKTIGTWVVAALRNHKFFTIEELNQAMREKLYTYNHTPFQKIEGSRYSKYLEEKPLLQPLPFEAFELAEWKSAKVQYNYHISVEGMNYSIPYEYIGYQVDVRITHHLIEVYYNNTRICSHKKITGHKGQYHTDEAHMPKEHQEYLKWDGNRFTRWAESIGPYTTVVIKALLQSSQIEQQTYRSCMAVLKLTDKYSKEELEASCERALDFTTQPSYKIIKRIITSGQDKIKKSHKKKDCTDVGLTRGAAYYERK